MCNYTFNYVFNFDLNICIGGAPGSFSNNPGMRSRSDDFTQNSGKYLNLFY